MRAKYSGPETAAAKRNFPFTTRSVHREFISSLAVIKKAAALANAAGGKLPSLVARSIARAADEIISGRLDHEFSLPALQGGAGTSINMNVNEVIAGRATQILKRKAAVHPNDHVNLSQSTNDVNPSALRIAGLNLLGTVLLESRGLAAALADKAKEYKDLRKLGRTHLQDAVPTTLGAEFAAYAASVERDIRRLEEVRPFLLELNLGGTAIGNSLNASPRYIREVYKHLRSLTGLRVKPAPNLMAQTSSQTDFVMLSQSLTALGIDLSRIANDLRLLASGPRGGLGEIELSPLQSGSSIMPGKVNPVLPEAVNQLYFMLSGNNETIQQAAQAAQLELGVMGPIIADRLLESLTATAEVVRQFTDKCVKTLRANTQTCHRWLEAANALATLLTPRLGYDAVSAAVKQAQAEGKTLREVVLARKLLTASEFDFLTRV